MKSNVDAFLDALREVDEGQFLQEIADKHAESVRVCRGRNKKTGIQISMGLKPNQYGQVELVGRVEIALPKSESFGAIFYTTEDGRLQRRDPRQPELPGIEEEDEPRERGARMRKAMAAAAEKVVPIASA